VRIRWSRLWFACSLALATSACAAAGGISSGPPRVQSPTPIPLPPSALVVAPFADSFVVVLSFQRGAWRRHSLEQTPTGYRFVEAYYFGSRSYRTSEVFLSPAFVIDSVRSRGQNLSGSVDLAVSYADHHVRGWSLASTPDSARRVAIDTLLPDSAFDAAALMAVLAALDWRLGLKRSLIEFDPTDGTTQTADLSVVAEEQVAVPAGSFEVYRAELAKPGSLSYLWYTRAEPHRLVKVADARGRWSTDLVNPPK